MNTNISNLLTELFNNTEHLCDVDFHSVISDMDEWDVDKFREDITTLINQEEVIGYYQADQLVAEYGYKEVVTTVVEQCGLDPEQLMNNETVATVYCQLLMTQELYDLDLGIEEGYHIHYLTVNERFFFSGMYAARALRHSLKVLAPCEDSNNAKGTKYYVREDSRAGYAITTKGELIHQWILDKAHEELYRSAKANGATHGVLVV